MKLPDVLLWQELPAAGRKRYFQISALLFALVWMLVFTGLDFLTSEARDEAHRLAQRHDRIAPLVSEIIRLEDQVGELISLSPLAAAQQVSRDLKLEAKLASIRPNQLAGGQEGVQLMFEAMDLRQTLDLLEGLRGRGNMKILSFSLNHRLDNPKLADLQLLVVR